MEAFARGFGDYVVAIAGGVGVALIAALILLALSRVTLPTLRHLWYHASPLGRLFFYTPEPDAILTPTVGGIYQLQATISDGVGGKATRVYKWNCSEDKDIGLREKDEYKAIGVANEQWQLDLLNCARGFLGKTGYGLD